MNNGGGINLKGAGESTTPSQISFHHPYSS